MLYKKEIELSEGREFGCLESGPLQSSSRYEAIRYVVNEANKQVIGFIVTMKQKKQLDPTLSKF